MTEKIVLSAASRGFVLVKFIRLTLSFLKNLFRQKAIIFSTLVLPLFLIWSTWWVTAEIPMRFKLTTDVIISQTMVNVHLYTGALTAMGLTAGLFGFIVSVENNRIGERLELSGYSTTIVNLSSFLSLLLALTTSVILTVLFTLFLRQPKSDYGFVLSVVFVALIYSAFGNFIASVTNQFTEGSLIVLVFSFIDLMLFSNPMGEQIYLQDWTRFLPGFWPTQLVLESSFIGKNELMSQVLLYSILYALFFLVAGLAVTKIKKVN